MNTLSILFTVAAVCYALFMGALVIAVSTGVERQRTYSVNMNIPMLVTTLLLVSAFLADTYL